MADTPPMLSSTPPPMDHDFPEIEDEEEIPNGFGFGRLDFDDDSGSPQPHKQSKSHPRKRLPPRPPTENSPNSDGNALATNGHIKAAETHDTTISLSVDYHSRPSENGAPLKREQLDEDFPRKSALGDFFTFKITQLNGSEICDISGS